MVDVASGEPVGTLIARSETENLSVVAFLATAFDQLKAADAGDFELVAL